jgi:predicted O-methyltransferase YrrM
MNIKLLLNKIKISKIKQFILYNMYENEYGGTVDKTEYEGLIKLASEASSLFPHMKIVEIGALFGFSTQAILEGSLNNKVVLVDNFAWNPIGLSPLRHELMLKSNLNYFIRQNRVEIYKGLSSDIKLFDMTHDNVSMVFIDADHSYEGVLCDIKFAKSINTKIICGDDYSFAGVKKAVDETFGENVKFIGDMWYVKLNS